MMMFDTCVTLQQSFTTWRRACTTELLICSVAGRRGCLPCRPKRNLKTVKDDAVQDRAQPSFSAVFQCSPSVSAPVLSMQPSFSAAFFQCSLLSVQPFFPRTRSFNAAFFQYSLLSLQPSFNTAFFQCSPSFRAPVLSLQPFFHYTESTAFLALQPLFHYSLQSKRPGARRSV
jgi:hypothetical protein